MALTFTSRNKKEKKRILTETRNNFYLSFFDNVSPQEYAEKEVNGFWIVKQWNPELQQPQCALYSPETFQRYKVDATASAVSLDLGFSNNRQTAPDSETS